MRAPGPRHVRARARIEYGAAGLGSAYSRRVLHGAGNLPLNAKSAMRVVEHWGVHQNVRHTPPMADRCFHRFAGFFFLFPIGTLPKEDFMLNVRASSPRLTCAGVAHGVRYASCAFALLGLILGGSASAAPAAQAARRWIATWAASPEAYLAGPYEPKPHLAGRTVRERMRVTFGGDALRVRISNEFGKTALIVGRVTIGVPTGPGSVAKGSLKTLTFSGQKSIVVPAGTPVLSDPVDIHVPPGSDVSVSIYLPQRKHLPLTLHALCLRTAAISQPGNFTNKLRLPRATYTDSCVYVTELLVPRKPGQALIVAFGDSITDGFGSTVNGLSTWPDDLERRLVAAGLGSKLAVVNEGISGNRLLHAFIGVNAQARFGSDVLSIPGARYVILLEGINDIGFPGVDFAPPSAMPTAGDIIAAYRQLIARAHVHGLEVFGGTLTPFKGTVAPYYTSAKESIRERVNHWIRTSGAFDGVIDFDVALRDPKHPHRYLPRYSSPDHLHPGDAGYRKMADTVNLTMFHNY